MNVCQGDILVYHPYYMMSLPRKMYFLQIENLGFNFRQRAKIPRNIILLR